MSDFVIQGTGDSAGAIIEFGASDLGGREFLFRLDWMERLEFWMLRMLSARREVLIKGIRVTVGNDMLAPYTSDKFPPGRLITFDTRNRFENPGRNDWRQRHQLVYTDPLPVEPSESVRVVSITEPVA